MTQFEEPAEENSSWHWAIRIPVALTIGFLALAVGAFSTTLIIDPPPKAPHLAQVVGTVFVLTCLWILTLAFRLAVNRPHRGGGLFPPLLLNLIAICMAGLPIFLVATGRSASWTWPQYLQAIAYLFGSAGLWRMAAWRRASSIDA